MCLATLCTNLPLDRRWFITYAVSIITAVLRQEVAGDDNCPKQALYELNVRLKTMHFRNSLLAE